MKLAYDAWIATLGEDQRSLVQTIMAVVMAMVDSRYNELASNIQSNERRLKTNSERIGELQLRLDHYEETQWNAAQEAIERFASEQLPLDERLRLVDLLHNLVVEVEELRGDKKQVGGTGGDDGTV